MNSEELLPKFSKRFKTSFLHGHVLNNVSMQKQNYDVFIVPIDVPDSKRFQTFHVSNI
mgnify:CR=1 FL=1